MTRFFRAYGEYLLALEHMLWIFRLDIPKKGMYGGQSLVSCGYAASSFFFQSFQKIFNRFFRYRIYIHFIW